MSGAGGPGGGETLREILVVCPDFHPAVGGYANAGTSFVRALSESGRARVRVVTWVPLGEAPELSWPNVVVERFPRLPEFRYSILLDQVRLGIHLRRLLLRQAFHFALFETFENPLALALCLWRNSALRRVGIRIHGCTETELFRYERGPMRRLYRWLQKRVSLWTPNIFSTTRFYREFFVDKILEGNLLRSFKNYALVPNCVFPAPAPGMPVPAREATFLVLGRFNAVGYNQKNYELVAQALHIVKRYRPDVYSRARLYIVGDGERRRDLESCLLELGVSERCKLIDSMPNAEVHAYQACVSASILVSRYEGMSMFALEALANGSPLILARGTGVSELVHEGENGTLVDPDDPFDLARALCQIAEADVQNLRAASRALFDRHYRPDRVIEAFLTTLEHCLASRK
jgi:glycosyltransferase involved in cell wall biosynthesis